MIIVYFCNSRILRRPCPTNEAAVMLLVGAVLEN